MSFRGIRGPMAARRSGVEVGEGDAVVEVDGAVVAVAGLAGFVLGVADGAAAGADEVEEGVLLAVDAGLEDLEGLAGGFALFPEDVAGGGPEGEGAGFEGELHRLAVGVGDEDDLLGVDVLDGEQDASEAIGFVWSNLDTHANDMPLESELIQDWMIGASMWGIQLWFAVPRNALIPKGVKGLMAAARHLGVGHDMAYALRMNALMGFIGEAAGYIAALAAKRGIDPIAVPYADFAGKLELPEKPLEYNASLWALDDDAIRAGLDSDKPGYAMWAARRNTPVEKLEKWYDAALPGSNLRRHLAFTLALKGSGYGAAELRDAVRDASTGEYGDDILMAMLESQWRTEA